MLCTAFCQCIRVKYIEIRGCNEAKCEQVEGVGICLWGKRRPLVTLVFCRDIEVHTVLHSSCLDLDPLTLNIQFPHREGCCDPSRCVCEHLCSSMIKYCCGQHQSSFKSHTVVDLGFTECNDCTFYFTCCRLSIF